MNPTQNRSSRYYLSYTSRIVLVLLVLTSMMGIMTVSCTPISTSATGSATPTEQETSPTQEITLEPPTEATLTVWVSDEFFPEKQTEMIALLNAQSEAFTNTYPDHPVEIRVRKDLKNWLSLTSRAAPNALPDLILLDHKTLEESALKGLLRPVNSQLDVSELRADILQTGMIQGSQFGLPVVADALVLLDHSQRESYGALENLFQSGERIAGDLGDPRSSLALSIYLSLGGRVEDENGRPILDEDPLRETLVLIQSGQRSASFGSKQNNGPTTAETWQEISKSSAAWWIGWNSQIPDELRSSGKVIPLPAINNSSLNSVSDGWYWTLSNPDPAKFEMADRLATIFMQPAFLNKIAETSGWMPVTQTSATGLQTLPPIQPEPDGLNLVTITPILRDCVLRVLTGESPELIASQTAALFR